MGKKAIVDRYLNFFNDFVLIRLFLEIVFRKILFDLNNKVEILKVETF